MKTQAYLWQENVKRRQIAMGV